LEGENIRRALIWPFGEERSRLYTDTSESKRKIFLLRVLSVSGYGETMRGFQNGNFRGDFFRMPNKNLSHYSIEGAYAKAEKRK